MLAMLQWRHPTGSLKQDLPLGTIGWGLEPWLLEIDRECFVQVVYVCRAFL